MDVGLTPVEQTGIVDKVTKKIEKQKQTEKAKKESRRNNGKKKEEKEVREAEPPTEQQKAPPRVDAHTTAVPNEIEETSSGESDIDEQVRVPDTTNNQNQNANSPRRQEPAEQTTVTQAEETPQKAEEPPVLAKEKESPQLQNSPKENSEPQSKVVHVRPAEGTETSKEENNTSEETQKVSFIVENFAKGTTKTGTAPVVGLQDPCCIRYTADGMLVVLDQETGNIHMYNTVSGDQIRKFRYLLNYEFQGGFAVTQDDKILVALKNEKYSSISFYRLDGQFKYSAFLDKTALIPGVVANTVEEIIAVDSKECVVCIFDREKRLRRKVALARESGDLLEINPMDVAINSEKDIIVGDTGNNCVRMYDYKGRFIRSVTQRQHAEDRFVSIKRVVVTSSDCILVLDNFSDRHQIDLFDPDGNFVSSPVAVTSGSIIDFDCYGLDNIVVLIALNDLITFRVYTFAVPRKFRKPLNQTKKSKKTSKPPSGSGGQGGCCCTIL